MGMVVKVTEGVKLTTHLHLLLVSMAVKHNNVLLNLITGYMRLIPSTQQKLPTTLQRDIFKIIFKIILYILDLSHHILF